VQIFGVSCILQKLSPDIMKPWNPMKSVRLEIILYHFCRLIDEQVFTLITTFIARPVLT
jgi:hypothetical protein